MFGKQIFLSIALMLCAATSAQAQGFDLNVNVGIGGGIPFPTGGGVSVGFPGFPGGNGDSGSLRNGLPPTRMDSFVYEAQEKADQIYGDEGIDGLPPFEEYTQDHRINAGILGRSNQGLTTGHGSMLPNATGGDEFVDSEPFTQAGTNSGFGGISFPLPIPGVDVSVGIAGGIPLPIPGAGFPIPGPGGLPVPGFPGPGF